MDLKTWCIYPHNSTGEDQALLSPFWRRNNRGPSAWLGRNQETLATWRLKRKDPYKGILPSELQSLDSFPYAWKEGKHSWWTQISIPSHYHRRPVDGACAAMADTLMQLRVPCKDTTLTSEQGDPPIHFSCRKTKPLVQVVSLVSEDVTALWWVW